MAAAIRPETVLVVGSAPSYAHGVVDPIPQLAAAAAERGVRFHVDACFGGWVLPYLRRLGADLPVFDFSVPGVTSVSVDLHKYAYAPKGVSILLHRTEELRRPQYFAYASWPGYTMINPVISSTRSGGPIAAALATLRTIGDAGYLDLAAHTREAVSLLAAAVDDHRRSPPLRPTRNHSRLPGRRLVPDARPVATLGVLDRARRIQPSHPFRRQSRAQTQSRR